VENTTTVVNNLIGIPVPVQYTQPIAQQGTTVYGYSSAADAYGQVDMGLLYNQAARLTDQAQQLAGQAATDFQALVQAEGYNRAEVAKILAQGQAAQQALLAAKGSPAQVVQKAFSFRVVQDGRGEMKVEQLDTHPTTNPDFSLSTAKSTAGTLNISTILTNRCVSCHSNEKASGNLNFHQQISDEQQKRVLERITTDNHEKRMPKGGRLSVDEISVFFREMGAASASK